MYRQTFHSITLFLAFLSFCILTSCSSKKFLAKGETVLSEIKLTSAEKNFPAKHYSPYVRQQPNTKWFSLWKVPLGLYCLSSADSVKAKKGVSRFWRRMGEAPVVYDKALTALSAQNLTRAMRNDGYLHARTDTVVVRKKHKTKVEYQLTPGEPFYVEHLHYVFTNPAHREAFRQDSAQTLLRRGMRLDLNRLAEERNRIVKALGDRGFYGIHDGFVTFDIDTLRGSRGVALTLVCEVPMGTDSVRSTTVQHLREVRIWEDISPETPERDSTTYRGLTLFSSGKQRLKSRLYASHINLQKGDTMCASAVRNSYANLSTLPAIAHATFKISPVPTDSSALDCDIRVERKKPNMVGLELEGTNTAGDLGAAASLTFSNRNMFRGSELLSLKLRGAFEAITGLEGYANENFIEWSAEASLRFPTLLAPFVKYRIHKALKAESEAKLMYDSQDRPEFHRRVLTASWGYKWLKTADSRLQHKLDLLSVDYVYMPWISGTFRNQYLEGDDPHYAVLRYSYENLFIMKIGYNFLYNSMRNAADRPSGLYQTNGFQLKGGVEAAGNLLYAAMRLSGKERDAQGCYNFLGINFSQYVKFDLDFVKSFRLNSRNSFAFHAAFGLGLPYGNSNILPYEKRYFSGGANSVRGWSVRELGPGSYSGQGGRVDFINQTGNLKLDLSAEWRTFLFWKLHGAFFIDAGNIWNTRSYAGMEDGLFHWNTFYRQIAVSYGLGLRLNFDYFILRFDGGMKAVNPAELHGRGHYPLIHPQMKRDFTFHFAVGLPF